MKIPLPLLLGLLALPPLAGLADPAPGDGPLAGPGVLPAPPAATPGTGSLAAGPRVLVNAFAFEGNTQFGDAELAQVAAPFTGRFITTEELYQLRRLLTLHYVRHGYINSGVIIPDQQVQGGIVRLRVIEGRLSAIEVSGTERLRPDYVEERLQLAAGGVLDMNRLQESIQLLHRNPLIERINAELVPGNEPGESRLLARVTEARPYELSLALDNHRPPSVGAYQLTLRGVHRNLTGRGDSLGANYHLTETEQTDNYGLSYALPLNARDTTLSIDYQHSNPTVVESSFRELDVVSLTERFSLGVTHPLWRTTGSEFNLGLKLDRSRNETFLLGRPYSFSIGSEEGRSTVTAARLSLDWLERSSSRVLAARATLSYGLDLFDATVHDYEPDGRFVSLLGQVQWARRLGEGNRQLVLRASGQWAGGTLLPLERFVVGGVNSVRGYRENRLVRDVGWTASAELRLPLLEDPEGRPTLQLIPFADAGQAWNLDGPYDEAETLLSVGVGLRWEPTERMHAVVYWGIPLEELGDDGNDLQDRGIHLQIGYRML